MKTKSKKATKRKSKKPKELIAGGRSSGMSPSDFDPKALARGVEVELEHTRSRKIAQEIAMDHLAERSDYYEVHHRAGLNPQSDEERGRAWARRVVAEKLASGNLPNIGKGYSDTQRAARAVQSIADRKLYAPGPRSMRRTENNNLSRSERAFWRAALTEAGRIAVEGEGVIENPLAPGQTKEFFRHLEQIDKARTIVEIADVLESSRRFDSETARGVIARNAIDRAMALGLHKCRHKAERCVEEIIEHARRERPQQRLLNPSFILEYFSNPQDPKPKWRGPLADWLEVNGTRAHPSFIAMVKDMAPGQVITWDLGCGPFRLQRPNRRTRVAAGKRMRNPTRVFPLSGDFKALVFEMIDDDDNVTGYYGQLYDADGPLGARWFADTVEDAVALVVDEAQMRSQPRMSRVPGRPSPGKLAEQAAASEGRRRRAAWSREEEAERMKPPNGNGSTVRLTRTNGGRRRP